MKEANSRSGPVDLSPVEHPSVWSGAEMRASEDWLYRLDEAELDELIEAMTGVRQRGLDFLDVQREDFVLRKFSGVLADMREELLHGRGFVQLRRLPVDSLELRDAALIYWGIGRHLGDEVASQNKYGHALGHVRDLGQSRANTSERGPYSSDRIPWHVDCCDIVGLLCVRPALSGGESSIASSGLVFNRLAAERPELAQALSMSLYRDRRDEVPPGLEPWYDLPVFNRYDGLMSVSIEPTYIGSAGRHFDEEPNSALQHEGIDRVQQIADEIRLDIPFEPGDMQFLNNYTVMHTRQAFVDSESSAHQRHLLRLWLLNHDGRALADAYYHRHGCRDTVIRPGGIIGAGTVLNCVLPASGDRDPSG